MVLGPPPTLIEHCHMRFVIAGMPDHNSIRPYVQVINNTQDPHKLQKHPLLGFNKV